MFRKQRVRPEYEEPEQLAPAYRWAQDRLSQNSALAAANTDKQNYSVWYAIRHNRRNARAEDPPPRGRGWDEHSAHSGDDLSDCGLDVPKELTSGDSWEGPRPHSQESAASFYSYYSYDSAASYYSEQARALNHLVSAGGLSDGIPWLSVSRPDSRNSVRSSSTGASQPKEPYQWAEERLSRHAARAARDWHDASTVCALVSDANIYAQRRGARILPPISRGQLAGAEELRSLDAKSWEGQVSPKTQRELTAADNSRPRQLSRPAPRGSPAPHETSVPCLSCDGFGCVLCEETLQMYFHDLSFDSVSHDSFKKELTGGFKSLGVSDASLSRLTINLRAGSIIAEVCGPRQEVQDLKLLPIWSLEVMGCRASPRSYEELVATEPNDMESPLSPGETERFTLRKSLSRLSSRVSGEERENKASKELPFAEMTMQGNFEGTPREKLQALVNDPRFELFFMVLILMNTVLMSVQIQYRGLEAGFQIGFHGAVKPAAEVWPGAETAFQVFEMFFGVLFTVEIVLKLLAVDLRFFCELWNVLDFVIVAAWVLDTSFANGVLPVDPMILRIFRVVKLLRMLRLIRKLQGFDSLYILITSVKSSISALGWSVLLLLLVLMMIGIFLSTIIEGYLMNDSEPMERRKLVYDYYGTFIRTSVTMFELTLANWSPASRALTENVSEVYILFVLVFQATIGFSVVKVIMGVFLYVTFQIAQNDDILMMNRAEREIRLHTKRIGRIFVLADEDGNGRLDADEFDAILNSPDVIDYLATMGFEAQHFDSTTVFKMLSQTENGDLSAEELVRGLAGLKGPATALNLTMVSGECREVLDRAKALVYQANDIQVKEDVRAGRILQPVGVCPEPPELESLKPLEERQETAQSNQTASAQSGQSRQETGQTMSSNETGSSQEKRGMFSGKPKLRRSRTAKLIMGKKRRSNDIREIKTATNPGCWRKARLRLYKLTEEPSFELTFAALISLNTLLMAFEVQYRGLETGYQLGIPGYSVSAAEDWPGASTAFLIFDVFFGLAFTLEIVVKLLAFGYLFCKDPWNILDFATVFFWYLEVLSFATLPIDPMLLRLFRLVKMMRMVRLIRQMEKFDALYLILTSMKGSLPAMLWSSLLMILLQLQFSIILTTVLEAYLRNDEAFGNKKEIYRFYGTFTRSTLTLFEITLADWVKVTRSMMTNVSELYVVFAAVHKCVIGFAVVMVLTGLFVQETMKVASQDNTIMIRQKEHATAIHVKKMSALFNVADEDGSGRLDEEEWLKVCTNENVKVWLSAMGLDVSDAGAVHREICIQTGEEDLNAEELVLGIGRLKGSARQMDLAVLSEENTQLKATIQELQEKVAGLRERFQKR
eukprot:TRINITY_DN22566_c0_g2_i1.p1 TRINITY_DN22566_c0_g2~~TRINITY_DN22566_c0_g2_i1.p1  ORF type:complete len:1346 (+),score=265.62 TRINITY_DN22566_c0_g2_i1:113-4150(+)